MKKIIFLSMFLGGIWLILGGCNAPEGKREEGAAIPPPPAVETVSAAVSDIREGVDVIGTLSPKFEASVKSEYLGIVTEVYVTEWVKVKKGQRLAKLDTREAENMLGKLRANLAMAGAGHLEAEAAAAGAEREYERSLKLKEYGLITQQNLDDAGTLRAASQAKVAAAKARIGAAREDLQQGEIRLSKALITAPMDGVVALRAVNVGDLVGEVGTPRVMFRIVDNRLLELVANVPSHLTGSLKVGQPVIFSVDAAPGKIFHGRVKFINPAVNESDRSVRVIAEVPNGDDFLKGGMFVQGRIVTSERKGALLVPRNALVLWDLPASKGELFVAENGRARRQAVRTGLTEGGMVEIREGLTAGEMVIVRGGFNVKDGDALKITENQGGN